MQVTFYGVRGSLPIAERGFLHVGGNTASVLVRFSYGRFMVLDAGTGIRKLGRALQEAGDTQEDLTVLFSHTHWDHIQGFPFFPLAFDPRRTIILGICGRDWSHPNIGQILSGQMTDEYFPIPLEEMQAKFEFRSEDVIELTDPHGVHVLAQPHDHPGGAFSYRISEGGKSLVYATDVEHRDGLDERIVQLARDADLLIHDAQYTPEELLNRKGWGHSSWQQAAQVAREAGVSRLALFHHDPDHDDKTLKDIERATREAFAGAFLAREGMTVNL